MPKKKVSNISRNIPETPPGGWKEGTLQGYLGKRWYPGVEQAINRGVVDLGEIVTGSKAQGPLSAKTSLMAPQLPSQSPLKMNNLAEEAARISAARKQRQTEAIGNPITGYNSWDEEIARGNPEQEAAQNLALRFSTPLIQQQIERQIAESNKPMHSQIFGDEIGGLIGTLGLPAILGLLQGQQSQYPSYGGEGMGAGFGGLGGILGALLAQKAGNYFGNQGQQQPQQQQPMMQQPMQGNQGGGIPDLSLDDIKQMLGADNYYNLANEQSLNDMDTVGWAENYKNQEQANMAQQSRLPDIYGQMQNVYNEQNNQPFRFKG